MPSWSGHRGGKKTSSVFSSEKTGTVFSTASSAERWSIQTTGSEQNAPQEIVH